MLNFKRIILPIFLASILLLQTATFGTAYSEPTISEQIKDPLVYQETESKPASDLWTKIFLLNSNVNHGDNFAYNIEFGNYGPNDATDVNYSFSILQEGVSITNVVTEGLCEWDSSNVYCYSEFLEPDSSTFAQIVLNVSEDASPALLMPTSDITAPVYDNVSTNNKSEIDGPAIVIPLEEPKEEVPAEEIPPSEIGIEDTDGAEADLEINVIGFIPPADEYFAENGFRVDYTTIITNYGPDDSHNIVVDITFDENAYNALIFDVPTPECQVSGNTMKCNYQTIPSGDSIELAFDVEYIDSENYDSAIIIGEVQSSTFDPNFENDIDSELINFDDVFADDPRDVPPPEIHGEDLDSAENYDLWITTDDERFTSISLGYDIDFEFGNKGSLPIDAILKVYYYGSEGFRIEYGSEESGEYSNSLLRDPNRIYHGSRDNFASNEFDLGTVLPGTKFIGKLKAFTEDYGIDWKTYAQIKIKILPIEKDLNPNDNSILSTITFNIDMRFDRDFEPFSTVMVQEKVPSWIKNTAGWWADDKIDDKSFVSGIQYLIREGIIVIDEIPPSSDVRDENIPSWIKNNARWWAAGLISENDFLNGLEYLISVGIISNSILFGGIGNNLGGAIGAAMELKNVDLDVDWEITIQNYEEIIITPNSREQLGGNITPGFKFSNGIILVKNLGPESSHSSTLIVTLDDYENIVINDHDDKCTSFEYLIGCYFENIPKGESKKVNFSADVEISLNRKLQLLGSPEDYSGKPLHFPIKATVVTPDNDLSMINNIDTLSIPLPFYNNDYTGKLPNLDVSDSTVALGSSVFLADPYVDMPAGDQGYLINPKKGDVFKFEITYGNKSPDNPSFGNHLLLRSGFGIDIEKWAKTQNCSGKMNGTTSYFECKLNTLVPNEKITKFVSVEITEEPNEYTRYDMVIGITSVSPDKDPHNNNISGWGPELKFFR